MALLERTVVVDVDGRRDGEMAATWGQTYMYDIVRQLEPHDAPLNIRLFFTLARSNSQCAAMSALRKLVEVHDSFRTSFTVDANGQLIQRLSRLLSLAVDVWRCTTGEDPRDVRGRLLDRYAARSFDVSAPPLIRCALVVVDTSPAYLLLVASHLVLDYSSALLVLQGFDDAILGRADVNTSVRQPLAQAFWESSTATEGLRRRSVAYIDKVHAGFGELHTLLDARPPERPRYWTARLTSPAMFAAAKDRATRLGVTVPSVLLAAYAAAVADHLRTEEIITMVQVSNRSFRQITGAVGQFTQDVPVRLHTAHAATADYVRHVHGSALRAYRFGLRPPDRRPREPDARRHWSNVVFNALLDTSPPRAGTDTAAPQRRFEWVAQREKETMMLYGGVSPTDQTASLLADTKFVGRQSVEHILDRMEQFVIDL